MADDAVKSQILCTANMNPMKLVCAISTSIQRILVTILTFHFAMYNAQTHFKNLAVFAARFLKCVWPFYEIAK